MRLFYFLFAFIIVVNYSLLSLQIDSDGIPTNLITAVNPTTVETMYRNQKSNNNTKWKKINYESTNAIHFQKFYLISKREAESLNNNIPNSDKILKVDVLKKNRTTEEYLEVVKQIIFPKALSWILIILHSFVFVAGLIGNFLVCAAVYRNHSMRTVTNFFIVNLAVGDFMVILICLPPTVVWDVTSTWFFGIAMCKIIIYMQTVSVTVSVLTLTFISIDRWYAICLPLRFKSTTGRAKTAIAIIWFIALIYDIPELVAYETVPYLDQPVQTIYFTQCDPTWSSEVDTAWIIVRGILLYVFPLTLMTITYCHIVKVLWRSGNLHQHSLEIRGERQTFTMNLTTEGQLKSRRKAAKMLVAVVIMFAICNFPANFVAVLRATLQVPNNAFYRFWFQLAHWLFYANSAINPIIYNFMSGKFRKEFVRSFRRCYQTSSPNRHRYQLNDLCPRNTENSSGFSQSRSSKRTMTEVRQLGTIEKDPTPPAEIRISNENSI